MKWSEIVSRVAADTGVSKAQTKRTLDSFRRVATETLVEQGRVPIPGIGVLDVRSVAERTLRSIHTGRRIWVAQRRKARFRPSGTLDVTLNIGQDFWKGPEHQAAWRLAETLLADLQLYNDNRAPDLARDASFEAVREACALCFGEDWEQAATTFASKVDAGVVKEHDHLASRARTRWSSAT